MSQSEFNSTLLALKPKVRFPRSPGLARAKLKEAGDSHVDSPGQHESLDSYQPAPLIKEDDFQKGSPAELAPTDLGRPRNSRTAEKLTGIPPSSPSFLLTLGAATLSSPFTSALPTATQ